MQSVSKTLASLFFPIAGSRVTALNHCFLPEPQPTTVESFDRVTGLTELFLPGQVIKQRGYGAFENWHVYVPSVENQTLLASS
jgi:hypothetical protein